MNATDEKKESEAVFNYKKDERKIFKKLLLEIFRSKKLLIKEFKFAQTEKTHYQKEDIKNIYKEELIKSCNYRRGKFGRRVCRIAGWP